MYSSNLCGRTYVLFRRGGHHPDAPVPLLRGRDDEVRIVSLEVVEVHRQGVLLRIDTPRQVAFGVCSSCAMRARMNSHIM